MATDIIEWAVSRCSFKIEQFVGVVVVVVVAVVSGNFAVVIANEFIPVNYIVVVAFVAVVAIIVPEPGVVLL